LFIKRIKGGFSAFCGQMERKTTFNVIKSAVKYGFLDATGIIGA